MHHWLFHKVYTTSVLIVHAQRRRILCRCKYLMIIIYEFWEATSMSGGWHRYTCWNKIGLETTKPSVSNELISRERGQLFLETRQVALWSSLQRQARWASLCFVTLDSADDKQVLRCQVALHAGEEREREEYEEKLPPFNPKSTTYTHELLPHEVSKWQIIFFPFTLVVLSLTLRHSKESETRR